MANTIISPNMNLPVPVVGTDPGPDWATNLNSSLNQIDAHNHTSGYGVQVPPGGLNINADLTFQSNNATNLRSSRYTAQSTPLSTSSSSDIACVYVAGSDLYFNDVAGNQVRITQAGGVVGTPGSIAGLASPASAVYTPGNSTFTWQSAINTPANMDFASAVLRNLTVNSKGLTLAPPAAMGTNFTLTLPSVPASSKILACDNVGNITATVDADGSTLQYTADVLSVKNQGITNTQMAANSIFTANIGSGTITLGNINSVSVFAQIKSQEFLIPGSFLVPNTTNIMVLICGGGGGGGGGASANTGGGGGGGGVSPIVGTIPVTPGQILAVSVPLAAGGGTAGVAGTNGGIAKLTVGSSSTVLIQCYGGAGGSPASGASAGNGGDGGYFSAALRVGGGGGGAAGGGNVGGDGFYAVGGAPGNADATRGGGGGGAAGYQVGGAGAAGANGGSGASGSNGGIGAGGGGGGAASATGGTGGAGGPGYVRIIWTQLG